MLRLSFKVLLIIFIALIMYLATFLVQSEHEQVIYTGAFTDKIARLHNHEAGSVILLGGSYSVFGMDASQLEQALGRPVVHMGLHAGIDLRFQLDSVRSHIQEGDSVILAFEYPFYTQPPDGVDSDFLRRLISSNPQQTLPHINTINQWQTIITYHSDYTINQFWQNITTPENSSTSCRTTYCRNSFSPSGSMSDDYQLSSPETREQVHDAIAQRLVYYPDTVLNHNAVRLINDFARTVERRGAETYITLPPLPTPIADASMTNLLAFASLIEEQLVIPVINAPYGLPTFLYYDTVFHLNNIGKHINTRYLSVLLNAELKD